LRLFAVVEEGFGQYERRLGGNGRCPQTWLSRHGITTVTRIHLEIVETGFDDGMVARINSDSDDTRA
jgi:hypothetical protein